MHFSAFSRLLKMANLFLANLFWPSRIWLYNLGWAGPGRPGPGRTGPGRPGPGRPGPSRPDPADPDPASSHLFGWWAIILGGFDQVALIRLVGNYCEQPQRSARKRSAISGRLAAAAGMCGADLRSRGSAAPQPSDFGAGRGAKSPASKIEINP